MIMEINENLVRVVILDISGVYSKIHNEGYFDKVTVQEIKNQYSDKTHWKVILLDC